MKTRSVISSEIVHRRVVFGPTFNAHAMSRKIGCDSQRMIIPTARSNDIPKPWRTLQSSAHRAAPAQPISS